jgi:hypothetical protein
MLLCDVNTEQQ